MTVRVRLLSLFALTALHLSACGSDATVPALAELGGGSGVLQQGGRASSAGAGPVSASGSSAGSAKRGSGGAAGAPASAGASGAGAGSFGSGAGGGSGTSAGGAQASGGSSGLGQVGGSSAAGGDSGPPGTVPGLIAVGYGGMRVVSRDAGATWSDAQSWADNGQDDDNLLRAVVYGKGLWLATGWKLATSPDGVHWTTRGKIQDIPGMPPCGIIEGLAFDGSNFYAGCTPWQQPGHVWRSGDGLSWTDVGDVGDTQGHLFLSYHLGKFAAYGDSLTTFTSTDAKTWQTLSGVQRGTWCDGAWKSESDCHEASWFDGVYLRGTGQGQIARSTNGATFTPVYSDAHGNGLYQSRAIAAGFVAP